LIALPIFPNGPPVRIRVIHDDGVELALLDSLHHRIRDSRADISASNRKSQLSATAPDSFLSGKWLLHSTLKNKSRARTSPSPRAQIPVLQLREHLCQDVLQFFPAQSRTLTTASFCRLLRRHGEVDDQNPWMTPVRQKLAVVKVRDCAGKTGAHPAQVVRELQYRNLRTANGEVRARDLFFQRWSGEAFAGEERILVPSPKLRLTI